MRQQKLKNKYATIDDLARDVAITVNNEPTFTTSLQTGTVSTSVTNALCGIGSVVHLMPTSAEAARLINTVYISTTGKGYFVVTHGTATVTASFTFDIYG